MIRRGRRLAIWLLAALLASLHLAAESAAPARVIEIEVAGESEAVARLRATANEVLGRLGITAVVRAERAQPADAPAGAGVLAQAYVDLEEPRSPRLVVVESATQRELARRTLQTSGSLETSVESVTLVLYMVMEALLSEGTPPDARPADGAAEAALPASPAAAATSASEPESSRVAQPVPARPQPSELPKRRAKPAPSVNVEHESASSDRDGGTAPVEPSKLGWGASAFLRVTTLDNTHALTGAGAAIEAQSKHSSPRPGALLFAAAHGSTAVGSGDTQAEIDTLSARLLATLELPWGSHVAGVFGAGGGVDWFRADTSSPAVGTGHSASFLDAALCALVGARIAVADPIVVSAAAGLDLDFEPREFVIQTGNTRRTLFEIERFRPSLMLGVGYSPGFSERGAR